MTISMWMYAVDAAVVSTAPNLEFALTGKTAFGDCNGDRRPEASFDQPRWTNQGRFVSVQCIGDDRQLHALFKPPMLGSAAYKSPEQQRERTLRQAHYERFYDCMMNGAQRAAGEIAAYLTFADFKKK